jgi:beta-glucanase (GH16 family)
MLSEQIDLPCNSSGQVENWPAFWLVTTGSWPAGGEIDVMEGLKGSAAWHYHYVNSSGKPSAVGGYVSGFKGCGTHTYAVSWTTSAITFYYDGKQAGRVTPTEIGVPIASGPMYVANDYAASSTYGGPTVGNVSMEVLNFTATNAPMIQYLLSHCAQAILQCWVRPGRPRWRAWRRSWRLRRRSGRCTSWACRPRRQC